jgi:hypothetical protein
VLFAGGLSCGGDDPLTGQVVINEMAGTGADFVEFLNTGSADAPIGGYGVTDSDAGGNARVSRAVRYPAGTVLRPGGYALAYMESNCPSTVTVPCVRVEVGIGQTQGDRVHLLSPTDQSVVSERYPTNAAPSGRSWGRIPNGTGAFQLTLRTPGAVNVVP